jgi:hypothetical protein
MNADRELERRKILAALREARDQVIDRLPEFERASDATWAAEWLFAIHKAIGFLEQGE